MKDPTQEAIAAVRKTSSQGSGSVGFVPPEGTRPARSKIPDLPDLPLVKQDSVEISPEGRAAAGGEQGGVRSVPAPNGPAKGRDAKPSAPPPAPRSGRVPDGDNGKAPDGDADDLRFKYDENTGTLQTRVVDPRTGKSVLEFPSDEQLKVRESLKKHFSELADRGKAAAPDDAGAA